MIAHTAPGELVNIRGPAGTIRPENSEMLIRTDHLEGFRYALHGGKVVATHTAILLDGNAARSSADVRG